MDFVSGALPNVMFIAGLMAIGLALGIEFKIVEVKGELSQRGRIGAFCLGAILIAVSVVLYTRPSTPSNATANASQTSTGASVSSSATSTVQASLAAIVPTAVIQQVSTTTSAQPQASQTQPSPLPTTTNAVAASVPSGDPLTDLHTLIVAGINDGRVREGGSDLLKKQQQLQDALSKKNTKPAGDRLRDLQNQIQGGAQDNTIDAAFAQEAQTYIQRIASSYGLSISAPQGKDKEKDD